MLQGNLLFSGVAAGKKQYTSVRSDKIPAALFAYNMLCGWALSII
jgi:hypothetical protein